MWRCGLSARTARDKLRVTHELRRRPLVAQAFSSGACSYCKVRAITRITDVDEECDRWLLALAAEGTVADLDRAVRHWQYLRDQEGGVEDYLRRWDRRWLRASRSFDGMVVIELTLPLEEGEEVLRLLDAAKGSALVDEPVDGGSREGTCALTNRALSPLAATTREYGRAMARERQRRPDLDERFQIETDDPEGALRRLMRATDDPLPDEDEAPEDEAEEL